ncbi:nitrous oxide reductase accessory protein NosL [Skermanella mucosa]|uniref:nitrous oxide reductase accessory protein NosL n=1 Tax=Skermanella mucosa TaxID=1789672 RepID=UPI00192ADF0D|nr:nitrous oxide reductase accessory protein NosL [Skermanella mucosa]UEM20851.1 nitrous oxide reductase accessory protein NosL [Skermanella mucosa]
MTRPAPTFLVSTILGAVLLLLGACGEEQQASAPPTPYEVTDEAIGHYCGMALAEHPGPKGQAILRSRDEPVWFSSARDAIAFTKLPEEPKDIAAIYVTDMAAVKDWDHPEPGTWVDARHAWYVIGSTRKGGMGGDEAVPFGQEQAARQFAEIHGGQVVAFDAVPESYVLGSSDHSGH